MRIIYSTQNMVWRGIDHGETPPGTKEEEGTISHPHPPNLKTQPPGGTSMVPSLPKLFTPSNTTLGFSGSVLPSHSCLRPDAGGPLPKKTSTNPANTLLLNLCTFGDLSSGNGGNRSHFIKQTSLQLFLNVPHAGCGPRIAHNSQRNPWHMSELKEKSCKNSAAEHTQHT